MPKQIRTAVSTDGFVVPFTVRLIVLGSRSIASPRSVYFFHANQAINPYTVQGHPSSACEFPTIQPVAFSSSLTGAIAARFDIRCDM